jgi:hypothetical protein
MTLSSLNIVHMVYVISYQQLKMETNWRFYSILIFDSHILPHLCMALLGSL